MMFSRILVPLDGTPESNVALPLARTIARAGAGTVVLLRVLERQFPVLPGNEDDLQEQEQLDDLRGQLESIAEELASGGVSVEAVVTRGKVAEAILEQVHVERADLVIMRTHGRSGLKRAARGSVTEHVLRQSSVPLLTLRPGGRRVGAIRKLLIPVDGSPGGAIALATAAGLARVTGASMHLLEDVVPVYLQPWAEYEGMTYYDPAWDDEALASAASYVKGMAKRLEMAGLSASAEAHMVSNIAEHIVATASREEADIIVMSTHALTGLPRATIGSVADAVARTAGCPVLLVRRPLSREAIDADELSEPETIAETFDCLHTG
jgi:nucleotide-binding universal stress UspA family protein